MSQLSRRNFLSFLGTAPVAVKLGILDGLRGPFDPHRVIFDMGRLWTPPPLDLQALTIYWQKCLDQFLSDMIFSQEPFVAETENERLSIFLYDGQRTPSGVVEGVVDAWH